MPPISAPPERSSVDGPAPCSPADVAPAAGPQDADRTRTGAIAGHPVADAERDALTGAPSRTRAADDARNADRPVPVIVNAGSGPDDGPDAATLRAAFAAHGIDAQVHVLEPGGDLDRILDRVFADAPACVVAGGGDGTINAVAARVLEDPRAVLGVLPLGTLNHFARDLGIPFELDGAVAVIAQGHCVAVDVGEVNDRLFLNNASIGLYATMVVHREREQKRLGIGKWPALAKATWTALRDPDTFEAVLCVDDRELRRRTPFIFVGNNDYTVHGPELGQRARLDDGTLSVYVLHPKGLWGLLWLGVRALLGRVSDQRDLDALATTTLDVESHDARVEVARDGEVDVFDTPVRFKVRPRALRVFAARDQDKARPL